MTAQQRAARVQLMLFDIDGVLTDGRLYFDAQGEAQKVFHVHDGHGLKLLREAGIMTGVVSGRQSAPAQARLRELKLDLVHLGVADKLRLLQEIAAQTRLPYEHIGFMGDDWVDLAVMQRVGFAATVANAATGMCAVAHWQSAKSGGQGAVREAVEFILEARGQREAMYQHHLNGGVAQG
ncbi:MAG: KdsC family phosphatase [Burkholderiales bacterium]|jgi:3-deoxy-D-manno-octulosonate 8-phosphate phosphatase (KDO 8-P phosphatase)|nr:3-deoxy-D-manno-octulosonate 8-phosphate phosphatase [Burkholderiales bacterium]